MIIVFSEGPRCEFGFVFHLPLLQNHWGIENVMMELINWCNER